MMSSLFFLPWTWFSAWLLVRNLNTTVPVRGYQRYLHCQTVFVYLKEYTGTVRYSCIAFNAGQSYC
jgi:hypothetical protein